MDKDTPQSYLHVVETSELEGVALALDNGLDLQVADGVLAEGDAALRTLRVSHEALGADDVAHRALKDPRPRDEATVGALVELGHLTM